MKRLYISDAVHEHLKQLAKEQGRTIQWVVESELGKNIGVAVSPKLPTKPDPYIDSIRESYEGGVLYGDSGPQKLTPALVGKKESPRTKGKIYAEIEKQKLYIKDLEDQTQVNQDPDLLELIQEEKKIYQGLWDEYNTLKGDK